MLVTRRNADWLPGVFNDFFNPDWTPRTRSTAPAVNVVENDEAYRVEIAAPGMGKEDFTVKVNEENVLEVTMEKKSTTGSTNEKERYLRREFSYAKFRQNLILPDDVDKEKITARVENGILTLTLMKQKPEEKPNLSRHIEVL